MEQWKLSRLMMTTSLPFRLRHPHAGGSLADIVAASCVVWWATALISSADAQSDLIKNSRASLSQAGLLTLDASAPDTIAYALFRLPTQLTSFATAFNVSFDPAAFRNGTISFILIPDDHVSAYFPTAGFQESSPQAVSAPSPLAGAPAAATAPTPASAASPQSFVFAMDVLYNPRLSTVEGRYSTSISADASLAHIANRLGNDSGGLFQASIQYYRVNDQASFGDLAYTIGIGSSWDNIPVPTLSSIVKHVRFVGLVASGGGAFSVSQWTLHSSRASPSIVILQALHDDAPSSAAVMPVLYIGMLFMLLPNLLLSSSL